MRDFGHPGMTLEDFVRHQDAVAAGLMQSEVAALRLYTGPAFKPINTALRAKQGAEWRTTISCCFSAILKLSFLSKPARVYRGVRETEKVLPPSFLDGDFAGGVELAFTSTTLDPCVAIDYSGGLFESGSLFVIDFDLTSRGASVGFLSQYPQEEELIFPPCTGLSCAGYSVRGAKRLILLRPTVSTERPDTSEIVDTQYVPGTRAAVARMSAMLAEGGSADPPDAASMAAWDLSRKNLSFKEAQYDLALLMGRAQEFVPSLTSLELSDTQLGNEGIAVIASGLRASTQLQHLSVARCAIGLPGATDLAEALRVNGTLTSLDLRGCDVDEPPGVDEATRTAAAAIGQDIAEVREHASLRVIGEALLANPSSAVAYVVCDMVRLSPRRLRRATHCRRPHPSHPR